MKDCYNMCIAQVTFPHWFSLMIVLMNTQIGHESFERETRMLLVAVHSLNIDGTTWIRHLRF